LEITTRYGAPVIANPESSALPPELMKPMPQFHFEFHKTATIANEEENIWKLVKEVPEEVLM
jgi:hypothetical protein